MAENRAWRQGSTGLPEMKRLSLLGPGHQQGLALANAIEGIDVLEEPCSQALRGRAPRPRRSCGAVIPCIPEVRSRREHTWPVDGWDLSPDPRLSSLSQRRRGRPGAGKLCCTGWVLYWSTRSPSQLCIRFSCSPCTHQQVRARVCSIACSAPSP